MIIGSSRFDRDLNINASFDEFRISKVARSEAQINQDYTDGVDGIPLSVDDNTTILLHFDNSIEDSELDHQTHILTKQIPFHSSGGIISIPKCSISLLQLQKYQNPSYGVNNGGNDDDDGNDTIAIPGYDLTVFYCTIITVNIIIIRKLRKKWTKPDL